MVQPCFVGDESSDFVSGTLPAILVQWGHAGQT